MTRHAIQDGRGRARGHGRRRDDASGGQHRGGGASVGRQPDNAGLIQPERAMTCAAALVLTRTMPSRRRPSSPPATAVPSISLRWATPL